MREMKRRRKPPFSSGVPDNRESYRGISRIGAEIIEFCPKSAIFTSRTGMNREYQEFPAKSNN
jgi:hypothetical protein